MTEHEKLKEICDIIGYDVEKQDIFFEWQYYQKVIITWVNIASNVTVDVREIIFTQEFRMLCMWYLQFTQSEVHFDSIMEHLGNPVHYLYKIIKW